ncbi:uncharacterized protein [Temnothorax nylanderi]|uniref:uncharacterized protein n=1 Tax=Temnothorax nylanderi TaxID=102681 RepID=UPI003A888241
MGRHCCVLGCSTGVNLPSHTFPKDVIMMNKWKRAVYSERIRDLTNEQLRKCVVCYRHFADTDYEAMYRLRRLKPGVVPSLHLPNSSSNNTETNNNNGTEINNDNNIEITVSTIKSESLMDTSVTDQVEEIEIIEIIEEHPVVEVKVEQSTPINNSTPIDNSTSISNSAPIINSTPINNSTPTNEDSLESEPSSPKNSTPSLLDLHTLLHGKYFHKFTPKMWKLYKLSCILRKKQEVVIKRQLSFRERIKQAKQYSKSAAIEKLLSSLTPVQQTFLQMQIRATKYAPRDRHFTLDEKIAALSIMKQSSKCYQYLTQVFNLPSVQTLRSILQKVNVHPGRINFINRQLKRQVGLMKERDKVCLLMWDEMLLQLHVDYDTKKKHIVGFEDFGMKRRARFADHALIFMVRGVQSGWKFPLAYYFCDGATKADQLAEWIKDVAKIVLDSGLHLVAFMCNDGKRNLMAINKLKLESARLKKKRKQLYYGYITIKKQDIIPLFDPPHLIKGIRNNLLNNDLEFDCEEGEERKFASWEIIEQAYHMDLTHSMYRLMPKITAEHIIKSKMKKKKVKNAAQVLSTTMGGFIHHHTKLEGYVNTIYGPLKMPEKKGRDTAEIILFFDRLFDSVNGHTLKPEKPLRVAISHNSPHFPFWERAVKRLQRMRFVDRRNKNQLRDSDILKNWVSTIRGLRKLWIILKAYEFKCLKPRILNQDCLRHFFGQIRSFGMRNTNPTCMEFESSFKTLLINNLTSPRTVENTSENKIDGSLLFTLKEFICKEGECNDNSSEDLRTLDLERPSDATREYLSICNSIAAKILHDSRIEGCDTCKNLLTDVTKSELVSSDDLTRTFESADDILRPNMSNVCYAHHTALMLETELYTQLDLRWLNCPRHGALLKKLLVSFAVVFYIEKWCNSINDILTEKDHDDSSK